MLEAAAAASLRSEDGGRPRPSSHSQRAPSPLWPPTYHPPRDQITSFNKVYIMIITGYNINMIIFNETQY